MAGNISGLALAGVLAAALSAACGKSLAEVESGVVAAGLRPALKLSRPPPTLAELTGGAPADSMAALAAKWEAAWARGSAAARRERLEEVYDAAPRLLASVDSAAARGAVAGARASLAESRVMSASLPGRLSEALRQAALHLDGAAQALSAGDWSTASLGALRAGDALREVSPRIVALELVDAAYRAMPAEREDDLEEPVNVRRARRLAWWARVAVAAGSYELAIQRAYYACLLLGTSPPG